MQPILGPHFVATTCNGPVAKEPILLGYQGEVTWAHHHHLILIAWAGPFNQTISESKNGINIGSRFQLIMKMGNNWCVSSLPSSVPWLWTIPRRTDWVIFRTPKAGTVRYPQQDRTLQLLPIFETPAITARKQIYFITHWSTIHPSSQVYGRP